MAQHIRHTKASQRVSISFDRKDLLWRHNKSFSHPDDKSLVIHKLPLEITGGYLVGPTVLDVVQRVNVAKTHEEPSYIYRVRSPRTLFRPLDPPQRDDEDEEKKARPDHPFLTSLASGGKPISGGPDHQDFQLVTKRSRVSISDDAFRLAVGMAGSLQAAYTSIAKIASNAWDADIVRSLKVWDLLQSQEDGILRASDDEFYELRPEESISQTVEKKVMAAVCIWLGIDPTLNVSSRPPGRPRKPVEADGVISMQIDNGVVVGSFIGDYLRWKAGQPFSGLSVLDLVELLGSLRKDGYDNDAEMTEAYLDAADASWRDTAASGLSDDTKDSDDPYDVLGLPKTATLDDVTKAYKSLMKIVHPDTSKLHSYFAIKVANAYKSIKLKLENVK